MGWNDMKSTRRELGNSLLHLLVCLHRSLIRWLRTARFDRALRCAHSLALELIGKRFLPMKWTRRFHTILAHRGGMSWKKNKRKKRTIKVNDETSQWHSMRNWNFQIISRRNMIPGRKLTPSEIWYREEICVPVKRFFRSEYFVLALYVAWSYMDWL